MVQRKVDSEHLTDPEQLDNLMQGIKNAAKQYRAITGRPLGVIGEVGEYEVARLLGLKLAPVREAGYDAIRLLGASECRVQIKARCVLDGGKGPQRLGRIRLDHPWDAILLVMLDGDLEPLAIYESSRTAVEVALLAPGSKSRNERGQLSVSKFRSIGSQIWQKPVKP